MVTVFSVGPERHTRIRFLQTIVDEELGEPCSLTKLLRVHTLLIADPGFRNVRCGILYTHDCGHFLAWLRFAKVKGQGGREKST